MEAMMCGCPVVATDVGNVADLLRGNGIVVTPNCPDELAAALIRLLDGPGAAELRASMAASAMKHAKENYTITSFATRFGEIYGAHASERTLSTLSRAAS